MTMTTLDAIQARTDAATEGPWEVYDGNEGTDYAPLWCVANDAFHNPPEDEEVEWIGVEIYVGDKADAEFIAHAREDVPRLVAALRRIEASINYWETLSDGDRHYAGVIRKHITEALGS